MSTVSPEIMALDPALFAQATGFHWVNDAGVDGAPDESYGINDATGQRITEDDVHGIGLAVNGELFEEFNVLATFADQCLALVVGVMPGRVEAGLEWEVWLRDGYGNEIGERTGIGHHGARDAWLNVTVSAVDLAAAGDEGDELVIKGAGGDGTTVSFAWPREAVLALAGVLAEGAPPVSLTIDKTQFRSATHSAPA